MGNYENYILECLKLYIEEQGLCNGQSAEDISGWINNIMEDMEKNQYDVPYDSEQILKALLSTCMASINPVNDKTIEISRLIKEYCLQWSEMNINGQIIRAPYVMNGTAPSWTWASKSFDTSEEARTELEKKLKKKNITIKSIGSKMVHNYKYAAIKDENTMKFSYSGTTVTVEEEIKGKTKKVEESVNLGLSSIDISIEKKSDTDITFKIGDKTVNPKFKYQSKNRTLKSIERVEDRIIWHFDGVNYAQSSNRILGNAYVSRRYENETYKNWKKQIEKELSKSRTNKSSNRDYQCFTGEDIGKAHPDTIVNYFNLHSPNMADYDMQALLETYCIGIDCSGFVSRAIAYVMSKMNDGLDNESNLIVQKKTIGLISGSSISASYEKMINRNDSLNNAASFFKFYRNNKDEMANDFVLMRESNDPKQAKKDQANNKTVYDREAGYTTRDVDDFTSTNVVGSRLIFRFSTSGGKLSWDRINKYLNPDSEPKITNLRPGDIITMADDEEFTGGGPFHIVLICDVGYDMEGPFFITADSSPSTLAESLKKAQKLNMDNGGKRIYSILGRPDSMNPLTDDDLDSKKVKANQKGTGVRFILHRDLKYFNNKKYLDFRRPYAFDIFYRGVNPGGAAGNGGNDNQED